MTFQWFIWGSTSGKPSMQQIITQEVLQLLSVPNGGFTSKPSIRSPKNITATQFKYSIIIPLCHRKLTFNNRLQDFKTHTWHCSKPRNFLVSFLLEWLLPTTSGILSTAPCTTRGVMKLGTLAFQELTPSFWDPLEATAFSEYTTAAQSCAAGSSAQRPQRIRDCASYRSWSDKTSPQRQKSEGNFFRIEEELRNIF